MASASAVAWAAAISNASAQQNASQQAANDAAEITVTATRNASQVLDVPATVNVVTRQQMDDRNTRDVQDLVRYQPGVTVDRVTSGTDPWHNLGGFTIRGVTGNRVQIQVDGARVQERITDGTRDLVDLATMKSVEILRGPGSVLWGADALGGIVAFRTLDPDDLLLGRQHAARLSAGYDSLDRSFSKTAIGAIQFTPTLQGILLLSNRTAHEPTLSNARADGGIWGCPAIRFLPCNKLDPLDSSAWNSMAKFVWRPSADQEWKLTTEWYRKDSTVNQLYDFNQVSSGIRNGTYVRDQVLERQRVSLSHRWDVGYSFLDSVKWNLSYSPQRRSIDSFRNQTLANGQIRTTRATLDFEEKFLQGDLQLNSHFDLGPTRHFLTYGFQGDHTTTDYSRRDRVTNLTTGVTTTTEGGGFNFSNATTTRADLYLQDEIKVWGDRLTITPGLRWANYRIEPRTLASYVVVPGAAPREITASRVIPQVGGLFKFDKHYSVYARYAEGFKMPTAQQLYVSLPSTTFILEPNPSLKPESVKSYEAGLRGKFDWGWFSVGVFHAQYTNFISELQTLGFTAGGIQRIGSINLASVKLSGIEAATEVRIAENWLINAALSYQYGEQRATPGAATTPFNAALPFNGVLGIKWFKPEWNLDVELISTFSAPVTRVTPSTNFKPPGYAVFDGFVNWKPWSNVTLRGGVMNIFDKRYFQPGATSYAQTPASAAVAQTNPIELQTAPGRTFKASMTVDF